MVSFSETRKRLVKLYLFTFRLGIRQFVKGIDFFRCVEYFWFFRNFEIERGMRLLDIGSWRSPLPSYLAKSGLFVDSIDTVEGCNLQEHIKKRAKAGNLTLFPIAPFEENPQIELKENYYDVITCICTIEHFRGDSDRYLMREMQRLLSDRGRIFLTIPYGKHYVEGTHYKWFERRYDSKRIKERLLREDFKLLKIMYFKDKGTYRFTKIYWKMPKVIRFDSVTYCGHFRG